MKHLYIAFLLICFSISAQNGVTSSITKIDSLFTPKLTGEIYFSEPEHLGSLFYNNKYVKSKILLSTDVMVYDELLKYDGYQDEVIWFNHANHRQYKLDKSFISDFWIRDSLNNPVHFKRINVNESNSHRHDFFAEVATAGKISLYIQRRVVSPTNEAVSRNDKYYFIKVFEPMPLYYIQLPSNKYLKMSRLSRRSFLNLFPEQKKQISKLVRKNHLNLKTETGLMEIIDLMSMDGIVDGL